MVKFQVTRYSVMGTSYGGFVAYHMARMWPERVDKVVIASSGVNMKQSDMVKLLNRAIVDKIEHLMLPTTPQQLRNLMTLAVFKTPKMLPDFLFTDMINVSLILILFIFIILLFYFFVLFFYFF